MTLQKFRDAMGKLAQEEKGAHFGSEFRIDELQEPENKIYDHFLAIQWNDPGGYVSLLDEIRTQESQQLNQSQKRFYHYLRNQIQIKMMENA